MPLSDFQLTDFYDLDYINFNTHVSFVIISILNAFQGGIQELKVSINPNDAEAADCDFVSRYMITMLYINA